MNYETKTRLVCTHLNAYFILNQKMALIIHIFVILKLFFKNLDMSSASRNKRTKKANLDLVRVSTLLIFIYTTTTSFYIITSF